MANFDASYEKMLKLEFSSASNALHKNPGESGLTFMGIYESAHPKWTGWSVIKSILKTYEVMELASRECYKNGLLRQMVKEFYKAKFWDSAKLDSVLPYEQAQLIFCFGVNIGVKKAVQIAQRIVGVSDDGIVGKNTLKALNSYSPLKFSEAYKLAMANYYRGLVDKNPKRYAQFLRGWLRRIENT